MKNALLQIYEDLNDAAERQRQRGEHDQGARSQVTSGKHMDSVAKVIRNDLIQLGYKETDVYYKDNCLRLPGWFRPSKNWDLLAFDGDELLAALELKSINSSFGNNANNRTEESLGSAIDAAHAIKNSLIPFQTKPPILGYVLVVKLCKESIKENEAHKSTVYPIDNIYFHTSYFQRLSVMCRRLLSENIYQAVWIVGVNPKTHEVLEPELDLTYDKFIASIKSQLDIHRA